MGWQDAPIADDTAVAPAWQSAPEADQGDPSQWGPSMEGANAAMFGMGPTINHLLTGSDTSKQEADAKAWEKQNSAPMGANGSFWSIKGPGWSPSEAGLADAVGGSIPYAAAGAATGGAGFIPELAAQAGVGAAGSSLLPLSQGQNPTSAALEGAATGALGKVGGDVAGSALGSAASRLAGAFKPAVNVPTAAGIQAAKSAAYDASEQAGDMASPEGLQRLRAAMTGTMADYGYDPTLQPGGQAVVNRMNDFTSPAAPPKPPADPGYTVSPAALPQGGQLPNFTGSSPPPAIPGSVPPSPMASPIGSPPVAGMTLKGLDSLRQVVNRMREGGPSGSNLARQLTGNIDDFVNNPQPGDWLGGSGPQGSASLNAARKLAQIGFKSDAMEEALERGQDSAAVSGSGGNANNTQARAAKNLKWSDQNWTPDEQAAQQAMIQGAPGPLRALSKMDAAGHGLGMAATLGMALSEAVPMMALGHPNAALAGVGAAATPAILGAAAKKLTTAMGNAKEQALRDTILNGGVNPNGPSAAQQSIGASTPALKRGIGSLSAAAMQPQQGP